MASTVLTYVAYFLLGMVGLLFLYVLLRIGSLAVFRSWSQVKVEYLKKLWLGRYKGDKDGRGGLDNETRRKDWN